MLFWLTHWLSSWYHGFEVFHYISLRGICSILTSFLIALCFGPFMIRSLQNKQIKQSIRSDGPQSHYSKSGTPTMGGSLILLSVTLSTLLWGNLKNYYLWIVLIITLLFGAIGWIDDHKKVVEKSSKGLPARWKYFWQTVFALGASILLFYLAKSPSETQLFIPFFKKGFVQIGVLYIVLSYFVIVGTSNAVNLTDGLDGLAIMPVILVGSALGVFAYVSGSHHLANYLHTAFIEGSNELIVFTGAIAGSGLGFLWFNTYPAQVFMGDVGALALGAALGTVAVIVRQELVLFIMGGVFVMETVSVILQVASFKLTGKRIFKMAPLHHHFEIKGWPEPKVIVRFWIMTLILVLIGFSALKIR